MNNNNESSVSRIGLYNNFVSSIYFRWWMFGLCLTTVSLIASFLVNDVRATNEHCLLQLEKQIENLQDANNELSLAQSRKKKFQELLLNESSSVFSTARVEIQRENEIISKIEKKIRGLEIESWNNELGWVLAVFYIPFILTFFIVVYLIKDFSWISDNSDEDVFYVSGWLKPFLFVIVFLTVISLIEGIITSVVPVDNKGWFSWNSFCHAPYSFGLIYITLAGAWIANAIPVAILFSASHQKHIPELNILSSKGDCGVGSYISLVKKWTFIGSLAVLIPLVIWIRIVIENHGGFSLGYLITPVFMMIGVYYLITRFVRNAFKIRQQYVEERSKLGESWPEIADQKLPPDPTLSYIGTEWWKLPTVVFPVLAGVWFFAEMLGVAKVLMQ